MASAEGQLCRPRQQDGKSHLETTFGDALHKHGDGAAFRAAAHADNVQDTLLLQEHGIC